MSGPAAAEPLRLARALLGGAPVPWPAGAPPDLGARFLDCCLRHGVHGLAHARLRRSPLRGGWPPALLDALAREQRAAAALELLQRRELGAVLAALAAAGVQAVLLKGTPLAYTLYETPALRPRADTDLLVAPAERERVREVLEARGYREPNAVSGTLVSYQLSARRLDARGIEHVLDVHWAISNVQGFAHALAPRALRGRALAVPALGPHARAPGPPDALLIACLHRVSHLHAPHWSGARRHVGDRLIWLEDIRRLWAALSPAQRAQLGRRAASLGVAAVCADGLAAAERLGGDGSAAAAARAWAARAAHEPSAAYLRPGRLRCLWLDLRALPGWAARLRLLAEHALPPADYVLRRYGRRARAWLPALYAHRLLRGMWRALRSPQAQ